MKYISSILMLTFPTLFLLSTVDAASFDCSQATSNSEKMICSDRFLSSLDESLSKTYNTLLSEYPELKQSQRLWLKHRNICQSRDCLITAHRTRISELFRKKYGGEKLCAQLNQIVKNEGGQALSKKHNEQFLGTLCGYATQQDEMKCWDWLRQPFDISRLGEMGLEIAKEAELREFIMGSSYTNYLSAVDINNDGLLDLRFSSLRGTLSCEYNLYFFGTADKKYRSAAGSEIGDYLAGEDAAFCGTSGNVTLREGNVTYVLSLNIRNSHIGTLYRGTENGSLASLCELTATPTAGN